MFSPESNNIRNSTFEEELCICPKKGVTHFLFLILCVCMLLASGNHVDQQASLRRIKTTPHPKWFTERSCLSNSPAELRDPLCFKAPLIFNMIYVHKATSHFINVSLLYLQSITISMSSCMKSIFFLSFCLPKAAVSRCCLQTDQAAELCRNRGNLLLQGCHKEQKFEDLVRDWL